MVDTATSTLPKARVATVEPEEYPYSDGRVLIEADPHANAIVEMRNQLRWHFGAVRNIYVAGSMAVYFREGGQQTVVAPDVFVALGVEKRDRKSYKVWEEGGIVPALVIEVASPSTSGTDATGKRETYERMGVSEYWRFDPVGSQVPHGLEGWRLDGAMYEPVAETRQAGGKRSYRSLVLGLGLRAEGRLLRFRDPRLGQDLKTHAETHSALHDAELRADSAERKAKAEAVARRRAERERDELNRRILELEARSRASE